jgi:hypothetical protein
VEDAARALVLVDGEIRPGDVAHEQAVPGQDGPGLLASVRVDQRERRVLGAVAGRVERAHRESAAAELPALVERVVLVVRRRVAVHVDRGAGRRREPPVTRDVIGVVVRLEDVLDVDAEEARQAQVLADVELRVDNRGDARVLVADQVAGAAEVVVDELAEDHSPTLRPRCHTGNGAGLSARLGPDLGLDLWSTLRSAAPAGEVERRAHEVAEQRLRAQRA